MEFLDDYDERPRVVFQSRPTPSSSTIESPEISQKNKPLIFISITISLLFLASSFFFLHSQVLQALSLWISLSFLVGPFAPLSITGGDIRVGQGKIVEFISQTDSSDVDESKKKVPNKRSKGKRSDLEGVSSNGSFDFGKISQQDGNFEGSRVVSREKENGFLNSKGNVDGVVVIEEKEWTDEDLGLLKKQIVKNPIGKPRRWEVISEAFKGRHSVESVINKAKSLGKEKPVDSDSYSKFLKDRKPVDKRVDGGDEELVSKGNGVEVIKWSSGEDIALLNALKTFPKDVSMRWEKIAAAVPGKSKNACMKRIAELKKDFRSSKASSES